ncbi:MAG: hypothetical protein AAF939_20785 [Planctomycetota bacterium]
MDTSFTSCTQRFLLTITIAILPVGCSKQDSLSQDTEMSQIEIASDEATVITNRIQLSDHVGEVVTLIGIQTRRKIPHVMGIPVKGAYEFSDQIVSVTGRLESYEVTKEDLDRWDSAPDFDMAFAASPILKEGIHFRLVDPASGDRCETVLSAISLTKKN